jgi:phosphoribosyl 1,2-cyclic phosphate phosphodiesterase
MKVTFLGTAAATAMPLPFCNCEICKAAIKLKGKDIRKRSSIVINESMLIDLGPDSVNACYQYDIDLSGIKYIVQTHAHSDHFDAGHFITRHPEYATQNVNRITLVASEKTLHAMNTMLKDEDESADLFCPDFRENLKFSLITISHSETIYLDEYAITALESLHDINQQSLIYLITYKGKKILYGTDLLDISEEEFNLLSNKKLDILILDQTYGEGYNSGGHLDAGQLITIIDKLRQMNTVTDATLIYATHISHEGNHTHEKMQSLAKEHGYHIAYDGLTITI